MTAEEFWKSWLAFWLLAGPGLLGFVSIAYSQYLSHCHLDAIKEALKNSRYIYLWGPSLGKRGFNLVPPGNIKNLRDGGVAMGITSHR